MLYLTSEPVFSGPEKTIKTWFFFAPPRALQLLHAVAEDCCISHVQFQRGQNPPRYSCDEQQRLLLLAQGVAECPLEKAIELFKLWGCLPPPKEELPEIKVRQLDGAVRPYKPGQLNDDSLMTFGGFKGQPLKAVPADRLLWYYDQPWFKPKYPALAEYIEWRREHLEKEAEVKERSQQGGFEVDPMDYGDR